MTFTHALSTNNYGPAKFIVSSNPANGTHTTIAAAIAAAVSGDTIFIRNGTYIENLTLKAGVSLSAFGGDSSFLLSSNVTIIGTLSYSSSGNVNIYGIQLQTNSSFFLSITGNSASIVLLKNCFLNCTNATGINFASSSASAILRLDYCNGDITTTGIALFTHTSAGQFSIEYCYFSNSGSSQTFNNSSAGIIGLHYSFFKIPFSTSGTNLLDCHACDFNCPNVSAFIINGNSGNQNFMESTFLASGSAITMGVGSNLTSTNITLNSGNPVAITGGGTWRRAFTAFSGVGSGHTVTTEIALPVLV